MMKKLLQVLVGIGCVLTLLEVVDIHKAYGAALFSREESVRLDLRRDVNIESKSF